MPYRSTLPTAFEMQVRRLGLDERTCASSTALRLWCEENKDHYYVPEWLLAKWGIRVEPGFAPDLHESHPRHLRFAS
jgi:hypothetical protein